MKITINGPVSTELMAQINLAKGQKAMTMEEAAQGWYTWKRKYGSRFGHSNYLIYVQKWLLEVGDKPVHKVDEDDIDKFVNQTGVKRSTRTFKLSVMRSFYKYLSARGLVNGDPSKLVRVDFNTLTHVEKESKAITIFYDHEFDQLLAFLDRNIIKAMEDTENPHYTEKVIRHKFEIMDRLTFWKHAVILGRCTGLRFGDICQLEWASFGSKFAVWTDKRNTRVEPHIWNPELFHGTFDRLAATKPRLPLPAGEYLTKWGQYCFPEIRDLYLNTFKRSKLPQQFKDLVRRAGLPEHTFHGLRHTYATDCAGLNIPTPHIAASLGHQSLQMTKHYIH